MKVERPVLAISNQAESGLVVITGLIDNPERFFGGVLEGTGPTGRKAVYPLASTIIELALLPAAENLGNNQKIDARRLASLTGLALQAVRQDLPKERTAAHSGNMATVAYFEGGTLAVVRMGHGWAAFLPDNKCTEQFGDILAISQAKVGAAPNITDTKINQPGVLVLGSGDWGSTPEDRSVIFEAVQAEKTDMQALAYELAAVGSKRTDKNVGVVVARIDAES